MGPALPSPQPGTIPTESVAMPVPAASPTPASPASNRAVTPSNEGKALSTLQMFPFPNS